MEYNNTYNGYTPFSVNGQYQQLPQTYYVAPPQPQTPYTAAPPYPVPGAFPYQAGPPIVRKIGEGTGVTRQLSRDDNGYSTRMPTRSHTMPAPGYTLPDQTPQPNGKRSSKKHRTYRRKTRFNRAFITLRGHSEIIFEHFPPTSMQPIIDTLSSWPHGIQDEEVEDEPEDHMWMVKLKGKPWRADGPNLQAACTLIIELFTLLNSSGYMFQTMIGAATQDPRFVFFEISTDLDCSFFTAYFSRRSRRVTFQLALIPPAVVPQIEAGFREFLPHARRVNEGNPALMCYEIETNVPSRYMTSKLGRRARPPPQELDPDLFFVYVIQILSDIGYNVVTSVCLKRSKKMIFTPPMELLIFRDKTSNRRS